MKLAVPIVGVVLAFAPSSPADAGTLWLTAPCKQTLETCKTANHHKHDAGCEILYRRAIEHRGQWGLPEALAEAHFKGNSGWCYPD